MKKMHEVLHNSIVGHLDVERTLKAISLGGHAWVGMRINVFQSIGECGICQKIKYVSRGFEDEVVHYLYRLILLTSIRWVHRNKTKMGIFILFL